MKRTTFTNADENQKKIMREIANNYKIGYKQALMDHPDWGKELNRLPSHTLTYFIGKFRKQMKAFKMGRKINRSVKQTDETTVLVSPKTQTFTLNAPIHCVGCGKDLTNIINTILLEQAGKI